MRAMILAAGRGERLRPLTDRVPKALVEVGGRALIVWHIERLVRAGLREIVINVSHLGALIEAQLGDGARWGASIAYSREPVALETAGGIATARGLLGEAPFLLVNADVWCDADFARLASRALERRLAHLVLVPNPPHHPQGDFSLAGAEVGTAAQPRYTYAGLAQLSPRIVDAVRAGERAALGPLLRAAAGEGRVSGELHQGDWSDAGTAERLAALRIQLGEQPQT